MKAILMSIKPEHLVKILNKQKTLELRKSVPTNFVGWVYLYCTKAKPLVWEYHRDKELGKHFWNGNYYSHNNLDIDAIILNGKIVARFWFDEYEKVSLQLVDKSGYDEDRLYDYETEKLSIDELLLKTCLEYEELHNYLDNKEYGYAWHIKNLEIFYKPMELSEFVSFNLIYNVCGNEEKAWQSTANYFFKKEQWLKKAPQSWQYVYIKEKE
jgi:predicted transcriptional regulator